MRAALLVCFAVTLATATQAAEWHALRVDAPARVIAIDTIRGQVRANAGGLWYAVVREAGKTSLKFVDDPASPNLPEGALPDGRVTTGAHNVARVWLAEPTDRYDHGVLGDKIEAGSVVIEMRDGKRQTVRLKNDAVFEDLEPRVADLDGDGHDDVIVVKSYLKRGSALAVIAERRGKYEIVAETPPLGGSRRWLDPVGVADFIGDGEADIALVRQPHVIGTLEVWSWRDRRLRRAAELPDAANHIAGTRAIAMHAVADFDGDGVADIAVPSLDRRTLRIVSFAPKAREIASIKLPAEAVTNLGLLKGVATPALALGLADGSLVLIERVR